MTDRIRILVGTSGWSYEWNGDRSLSWYVRNSGLNAIELNMSFYRFPSERQVADWARTGEGLDWTVKVPRSVTHAHLLNGKGREIYSRFRDRLGLLGPRISYFLFQFPPRFDVSFSDRLRALSGDFDDRAMAFEFRHPSWGTFDFDRVRFGGVVVSPDSPDSSGVVTARNGLVYLRFHGRSAWYAGTYTDEELSSLLRKALALSPRKIHAFFNNDHGMLETARSFRRLAGEAPSGGGQSP